MRHGVEEKRMVRRDDELHIVAFLARLEGVLAEIRHHFLLRLADDVVELRGEGDDVVVVERRHGVVDEDVAYVAVTGVAANDVVEDAAEEAPHEEPFFAARNLDVARLLGPKHGFARFRVDDGRVDGAGELDAAEHLRIVAFVEQGGFHVGKYAEVIDQGRDDVAALEALDERRARVDVEVYVGAIVFRVVVPGEQVFGVGIVVERVRRLVFLAAGVGEVPRQACLACAVVGEDEGAVGWAFAFAHLEAVVQGFYDFVVVVAFCHVSLSGDG